MDDHDQFTRSLVRMLQAGTLQEFLGCEVARCAKVEFRLQRRYHVHVARRRIVIERVARVIILGEMIPVVLKIRTGGRDGRMESLPIHSGGNCVSARANKCRQKYETMGRARAHDCTL